MAAIAGITLSGAVSADTLAQPRETALERKAADYVRFREDVIAIEKTPFDSADTTRNAHRLLSVHDSKGLSAGWVAYAALVAADTPAFAEALKAEIEEKKRRRKRDELAGRDAFFAKLSADPTFPRQLPGADEAIARVLAMTTQDTARITTLGESFKEQGYALQKTKWGKARIAAGSERLSDADRFASNRPPAAMPQLQTMTDSGVTAPMLASASEAWDPAWGAAGPAGRMSEPNAQVIIDRVLNLAARYAVGGLNEKVVDVYARNDKSENCLSLAKLTLKQCIAATRTPYEEAFCLGEHALNDRAMCVGWVAAASGP